ncbi:MAG: hypothetical protein ABI277_01235 [Burkholderiaceae bacterium]
MNKISKTSFDLSKDQEPMDSDFTRAADGRRMGRDDVHRAPVFVGGALVRWAFKRLVGKS